MSHKGVDSYNRWRSKTVTFRASPEELEEIKRKVALSGLTKQDYFLRRLLDEKAEVIGNPRAFKALREELDRLCGELSRLSNGKEISDRLLDMTGYALSILEGLLKPTH